MKIAILGSGGREHAIAFSISQSKKVKKIYCIPGNAGTNEFCENVYLEINEFEEIQKFLNKNNIDLVIVGPENPLVNGIVDYLEKFNIRTFGPSRNASQLEGSKIFTKNLCKQYNIPTANFGVFENIKDSKIFLENSKHPIVIKADNLAAGKGVYICENLNESCLAVEEIFNGKFGDAKNVLIEEYLQGEEMSYFIISDGKTIKNFGTAQDHKRVNEGEKGKNTGGMGAYSPSRLINQKLEEKIIEKIIKPTLRGLKDQKIKYKGFLYAGLMIVNNEPFLIEYNVRMGDPECQTILPLLENDFLDLIENCIKGNLQNIKLNWKRKKSICIVLTSKGYPGKFDKNLLIQNVQNLNIGDNQFLFHAGTKFSGENFYSNGGRVLNFVTIDENFKLARDRTLDLIRKLNWKKGHYRADIGYKVI